MIFCTLITVKLPTDMPAEQVRSLREAEKSLAQEYMRCGKLRHLWRVAGRTANVSIWDCDSAEDFHAAISELPLFPYFELEIIPLIRHPSDIHE